MIKINRCTVLQRIKFILILSIKYYNYYINKNKSRVHVTSFCIEGQGFSIKYHSIAYKNLSIMVPRNMHICVILRSLGPKNRKRPQNGNFFEIEKKPRKH
jgi:hypothetical protein